MNLNGAKYREKSIIAYETKMKQTKYMLNFYESLEEKISKATNEGWFETTIGIPNSYSNFEIEMIITYLDAKEVHCSIYENGPVDRGDKIMKVRW